MVPVARLHEGIRWRAQAHAGAEAQAAVAAASGVETEAQQPARVFVVLEDRRALELARAPLDERFVGVAADDGTHPRLRQRQADLRAQRELVAEARALVPVHADAQATVGRIDTAEFLFFRAAEQAVDPPGGRAHAALDAATDLVEHFPLLVLGFGADGRPLDLVVALRGRSLGLDGGRCKQRREPGREQPRTPHGRSSR